MNSLFPVKVAVIRAAATRALESAEQRIGQYTHEQALAASRTRWWHGVDGDLLRPERYDREKIRIHRSMRDDPLRHPAHLYASRYTAQSLMDATEACDLGGTAYLSAEDAAFVGLEGTGA